MAETINISKIAEKLSDEIFSEFFWGKCAPTNENWPCEEPEKHKVKTHPSDVVFYYDEPYVQSRTYINCDLKSYASGSITSQAIKKALVSLAAQVTCANQSETFFRLFVDGVSEYDVCGLLFIYNHDGEYDKNFKSHLDEIDASKLELSSGDKMFVLGPSDIEWLDNVCTEIRQMRGRSKNRLPDQEHCTYFYPQIETRSNVQLGKARAATLEMLTSPWIVLRYTDPKIFDHQGYVVFYRGTGESSDEFLFIIDYLKHFQVLRENTAIIIKMLNHVPDASAQFQKAVRIYIEGIVEGQDSSSNVLAGLVGNIEYSEINRTTTSFSPIQLGME